MMVIFTTVNSYTKLIRIDFWTEATANKFVTIRNYFTAVVPTGNPRRFFGVMRLALKLKCDSNLAS